MDSDGVSRRAVLGGVVAAMAGGGCLATGKSPKPRASDWPQQGYDAGGTSFKSDGSPPTAEPEVVWNTQVSMAYRPHYLRFPHVVIGNGTVYTSGGTAVSLDSGTVQGQTGCYNRCFKAFARTESYTNGVLIADDEPLGLPDSKKPSVESLTDSIRGFRPDIDSTSDCTRLTRWTAGSPTDIEMDVERLRVSNGEIIATAELPDEGERDTSALLMGIDTDDGAVNWRTSLWTEPFDLYVDADYIYMHFGMQMVGDEMSADDNAHNPYRGLVTVLDRETRDPVYQDLPEESRSIKSLRLGLLRGARDGIAYVLEFDPLDKPPYYAPILVAFDVAAGEPRWRVDLTEHATYDRDELLNNGYSGVGPVAIGPDKIYASFGDKLGAFSTTDGSLQWLRKLYSWNLTATPDALYSTSWYPEKRVSCSDPETGETLWSRSFGEDVEVHKLIVADSKLLVPLDSQIVALEEQ